MKNFWLIILTAVCMAISLPSMSQDETNNVQLASKYYQNGEYEKALTIYQDLYAQTEYKSYRDELFNVSHREYSTGFFYGRGPIDVDDDINKPTTDGYLRDYLFLGTIGAQVKPGIYEVDIKNQIKTGDNLEFIGPDVLCLKDDNICVLDESFAPIEHLDHCRSGFIKTSAPLKEGYIIRKEIRL